MEVQEERCNLTSDSARAVCAFFFQEIQCCRSPSSAFLAVSPIGEVVFILIVTVPFPVRVSIPEQFLLNWLRLDLAIPLAPSKNLFLTAESSFS